MTNGGLYPGSLRGWRASLLDARQSLEFSSKCKEGILWIQRCLIYEDLERSASDPLHPTCDHSEYLKTEAQRGLRSPRPRFEHLRSGVLESILEPDGPSLKMLGRIFSSDDWLKWHAR